MDLRVDHVPFAGDDLDGLVAAFERVGLDPEYGGVHGDGTTHMSLVGFDDGSYLELVAPTSPTVEPGLWPAHLRGSAGPCAWCVRVDDVGETLERVREAGVSADGPQRMSRERADGTVVEWDLGFPGSDADRLLLPFVIADRTPREYRVTPTESVSGGPLAGVETVVLGVRDVDGSVETFRRALGLSTPVWDRDAGFGADLAGFPGKPVVLATPAGDNWLADRLDAFGECPCAYLLGADDFAAAVASYPLSEPVEWFGRRVSWFDDPALERRLGVVERGENESNR